MSRFRAPDPESVRAAADRAERMSASGAPTPSRGRGQLSSLDLLPEEADEDVRWAVEQLNARKLTQEEIRFELNDRLAKKGLDGLSRSAFNRSAMKLTVQNARFAEMDKMMAAIGPRFTGDKMDETSIVLAEMMKMIVFELVQNEGATIGTKGVMELARAHLAVIQGSKMSSDRRRRKEDEFLARTAETVDKVMAEAGLSGERAAEVRLKVLGARKPEGSAA